MKEIENIYKIIHDETYKNQVLLDIEISKITDEKLVVGMLVDLYSKEGYKADKAAMILSMRNYGDIGYYFIDDFGDKPIFFEKYFVTLEQWREQQLNKILEQ